MLLLGQSLGTAVASAVASALPSVDFAGVILVAPFTSLPSLLQTYRILGVIPILSPLRAYPRLQKLVSARIVDTWDTRTSLESWVRGHVAAGGARKLRLHLLHARDDFEIGWRYSRELWEAAVGAAMAAGDANATDGQMKRKMIEQRVKRIDRGEGGTTEVWDDGRGCTIRLDVLRYGGMLVTSRVGRRELTVRNLGHNAIVGHTAVALAALEAFDL